MDNLEAIKIGAIIAAVAALIYLVKKKGAAGNVGAAVGGAIVDAAGGLATGVIDGISTAIGIPTTSETITNVSECQSYMDQYGVWASSGKCGLPTFMRTVDFWPSFSWMPADTEPRRSTGAFDRQL